MSNHQDSHSNDHGHDNTEGNRQYYPQGWYLPLVGLFVLALAFGFGAGSLLDISGTDKWGKSAEEGHGHDSHQTEGTHDAGNGDADHQTAPAAPNHNVSVNVTAPTDTTPKADSPVKAEEHAAGDGHGH